MSLAFMSRVHTAWLGRPRRVCWSLAALCFGLLGFGLYLQHGLGLEPCPMCIMQRYLWLLFGLVALFGGFVVPDSTAAPVARRWPLWLVSVALLCVSLSGAYVAARQSWLQWHPPAFASCGRDFYGIVETFPLHQALPLIFRGSGDCSAIDWTFLGGTIANWSFVCFVSVTWVVLAMLRAQRRLRAI